MRIFLGHNNRTVKINLEKVIYIKFYEWTFRRVSFLHLLRSFYSTVKYVLKLKKNITNTDMYCRNHNNSEHKWVPAHCKTRMKRTNGCRIYTIRWNFSYNLYNASLNVRWNDYSVDCWIIFTIRMRLFHILTLLNLK